MNILVIEDDPNKSKQILDFISKNLLDATCELKKSYQSGLKEVLSKPYDIILLDMQLPNFEIKPGEDGYKFRKLAGFDILRELKRKNIQSRVIVVTQFETFGEGESYIELEGLKHKLNNSFPTLYVDTVFYSADKSIWQKQLNEIIVRTIR
ncbi:response regulator [Flavobacterium psychrotrophum]|uniref:response regulator n=1 Tax=Flavobacterium psychrotrophum TaxID=2294119 RepID=UPI000E31F66D|nr:response regulator [Flavobacterium psychrotrophum]